MRFWVCANDALDRQIAVELVLQHTRDGGVVGLRIDALRQRAGGMPQHQRVVPNTENASFREHNLRHLVPAADGHAQIGPLLADLRGRVGRGLVLLRLLRLTLLGLGVGFLSLRLVRTRCLRLGLRALLRSGLGLWRLLLARRFWLRLLGLLRLGLWCFRLLGLRLWCFRLL